MLFEKKYHQYNDNFESEITVILMENRKNNRRFAHDSEFKEERYTFIQNYISNPMDMFLSAINEKI